MNEKETRRMTMAQALVGFLKQQYVERDGHQQPFFAGVMGMFGHGIAGGLGQALQQDPALRFILVRNEQGGSLAAVSYAKIKNRLQTIIACSSIGPGATNMVTSAAAATINRLSLLMLSGDIFARRNVAPVLQQLESPASQDISVNDCFKPVCRYWDRINRPDQLITSLPEAMRVLTSPADTGAVMIALPEDVQAQAFDYPVGFLQEGLWHIPRYRRDVHALSRAVEMIRASRRPFIAAGGGVIYSDACATLAAFVDRTGIPVGETLGGKGTLRYDHQLDMGTVGIAGTFAANRLAHDADLVIGIGTRYADCTTSSKTVFQNPDVRFVNINVTEFDADKHYAQPLVGDARAVLEELSEALADYRVDEAYRAEAIRLHDEWDAEVTRIYAERGSPLPGQAEIVGAIDALAEPDAIIINAAGSLPGDLGQLLLVTDSKTFNMEFGYSTMGYEVAGGLGAKLAAPDREVIVVTGDGTYLMLNNDLATTVQEGLKIIVVVIDNRGFKSIGSISRDCGQDGFAMRFTLREGQGMLSTDSASEQVRYLPVDFALNACSLRVDGVSVRTYDDFVAAFRAAKASDRSTLIHIVTDRYAGPPGYGWWDVPPAEVSEMPSVQAARAAWEKMYAKERYYF